jgi:hypothetical protein
MSKSRFTPRLPAVFQLLSLAWKKRLVPRQREFDEYENLRYSLDTTYMEERQTCLNKNTSWI